jgi:hypothetical protein
MVDIFRYLGGASGKSLGRGDSGEAEAAGRPMRPATTPDEGMFVRVRVLGGAPDGRFDLGPGLAAAALRRPGAQGLPPRLDRVEGGRVLGLEDELQRGWSRLNSSTSGALWVLRLSRIA